MGIDFYSRHRSIGDEVRNNGLNASVIIPSYYRSYDIFRLFECLLDQKTKPDEVLVVDDTLNNNSIRNLCEEFKGEFNRTGTALVYVRKQERSISRSRNVGAKTAQGEILVFLDSDTMPFPDYIEKVLQTFNKNPNAIAIGGWFPPSNKNTKGLRYHSGQILRKLCCLTHDSHNSCKNFEYPITLSNTIHCQYLIGDTMSFRRRVFDEFQFDENLGAYSFGEDFLFSNSVSKKHPNSLLLSPDVRSMNVASEEARVKGEELLDIKFRNGKYILTKLWGLKGLLIFGRQYIGLVTLNKTEKIKRMQQQKSASMN